MRKLARLCRKPKRRSRNAEVRRRGPVRLSTTAGAFLTAAMAPMANAPPADADFGIDDLIIDPCSTPGSIAALACRPPAGTVDLGASLPLTDVGLSRTGTTDHHCVSRYH